MAEAFGARLTPRFKHGLVIGKFFPPHDGHLVLIRSASLACERLTVGIFGAESKLVPLALRERALRAGLSRFSNIRWVHAVDDVPIDYQDSAIWDRHVEIFRQGLETALAREGRSLDSDPLDAVFTSEDYGDELARRLGCLHVCVDLGRSCLPFSATAFRADPIANWDRVAPDIQAALCRRVVIVGAESTGTTTLARDLSSALRARGGVFARTRWIPEFGREHSAAKLAVARALARKTGASAPSIADVVWNSEDFIAIARIQTEWEQAAATRSGPVLVCDTDALATAIWHERYMGSRLEALDAVISELPSRILYVLTDHAGVPFEDDGLRDGESIREWMTGRFAEELEKRGFDFIRVRGRPEERVKTTLRVLDSKLASGWEW